MYAAAPNLYIIQSELGFFAYQVYTTIFHSVYVTRTEPTARSFAAAFDSLLFIELLFCETSVPFVANKVRFEVLPLWTNYSSRIGLNSDTQPGRLVEYFNRSDVDIDISVYQGGTSDRYFAKI